MTTGAPRGNTPAAAGAGPSRASGGDEGTGGGPSISAHDRALRLLSFHSRSRRELETRLLRAGHHPDEVRDAIDRLERTGLVDDEAFARAMAEHQVGSRLAGRRAAVSALVSRGVPREVAERAVSLAEGAGWEMGQAERALALARRRAGALGKLPVEVAFRRLAGFLQRRGYGHWEARAAAAAALGLHTDPDDAV